MSAVAKGLSHLHFRTDAVRLRVQMVRRDQAAVRLGPATVCGVAVLPSAGRRGAGADHPPADPAARAGITTRCLIEFSDSVFPSFPNSVWERTPGNSVSSLAEPELE